MGQEDQLGEWFSSTVSYCSSPTREMPWLGQNEAAGEYIDSTGQYAGAFTTVVGGPIVVITYLPVASIEEFPMWILQGDAGGHPRPYDGSDVSYHPGNIVTVYYNDIHDEPGPDNTLIAAFNSAAGAFVSMGGDSTMPSQYRGIHQVTAYGADKPYHDTQDTHNWFQFICGGAPAGLWGSYGAFYRQVTFSITGVTVPPSGVITLPGGADFRDGFRGMTWMKNVVVMSRDIWDNYSTPYSGQLFPNAGGSGESGQAFP